MDALKSLFGGGAVQKPLQEDNDFADFAGAPAPSPASPPVPPIDAQGAVPTGLARSNVPYTKWYRIWERASLEDFKLELIIIPCILVAILVHFWGVRRNAKKAKKWMAVHKPILETEFAMVGLNQIPHNNTFPEGNQMTALFESSAKLSAGSIPDGLIEEKTPVEYETYASGRQNVAFADMKIFLKRRMNPFMFIMEEGTGLFFESLKPKPEHMEAIMYTFDGMEKDFVPRAAIGGDEMEKIRPIGNSSYDQFVFAIVHKTSMRLLRDERYDVSLTATKDSPKLPMWVTVMSESAEITDTILTKELISAIETAGDNFQYLIISDQPIDKPTTLKETTPKKRLHLSLRLPSNGNYLSTMPIFQQFIRLPDHLAASAHFRPEVMKKVMSVRETEKSKLKKVSDAKAEEDRLKTLDKLKKEERDRKFKGLSAEEQRKLLDKENEKSRKKQEKKMTRRG